MPNWCCNELTFEGNADNIQAFIRSLSINRDSDPSLQHFEMSFKDIVSEPSNMCPYGSTFTRDSYTDYLKDHNLIDWFTWRLAHWGCKGDVYDLELFENGMSFMTAWSPPTEVIDEIWRRCQESYPNIHMKFSYNECGNLVCGEFGDGVWNHRNPQSYENDCKDCHRYIPYDLPDKDSVTV